MILIGYMFAKKFHNIFQVLKVNKGHKLGPQ